MNFWKEHFDHILLALLGIAGGVAGAWCSAHHLEDSSKWHSMGRPPQRWPLF
jgi:hypothetical protein